MTAILTGAVVLDLYTGPCTALDILEVSSGSGGCRQTFGNNISLLPQQGRSPLQ